MLLYLQSCGWPKQRAQLQEAVVEGRKGGRDRLMVLSGEYSFTAWYGQDGGAS